MGVTLPEKTRASGNVLNQIPRHYFVGQPSEYVYQTFELEGLVASAWLKP